MNVTIQSILCCLFFICMVHPFKELINMFPHCILRNGEVNEYCVLLKAWPFLGKGGAGVFLYLFCAGFEYAYWLVSLGWFMSSNCFLWLGRMLMSLMKVGIAILQKNRDSTMVQEGEKSGLDGPERMFSGCWFLCKRLAI